MFSLTPTHPHPHLVLQLEVYSNNVIVDLPENPGNVPALVN